jgi:N-acetylglucosamine-6-phosphate deacetylase
VGSLSAVAVLLADGSFTPAVLELDGEHIGAVRVVEPRRADRLPRRLVVPGFVDLQVNGHEDIDVATVAGSGWNRLDTLLLRQGVTTFCPTLTSAPLASYPAALARIAAASSRPGAGRPHIAGAHLEGPFLGGAIGAHRAEHVAPVDAAWLAGLPAVVRIVTLAPESVGATGAVAALASRGVLVSLGHSTASYEQAEAAVDAGARLVTHLFNAMGPFHHRQPGLVGAALTDDRLCVSVIADGVHLDAAALRLAFRAKPPGSVALVTDAVAWQRSGLRVTEGAPRLDDGTIAGSASTMDAAVRTAVAGGVPRAAALVAATATPARLLGLTDRGRIGPGQRADLVVLTPELEVAEVWVGGQRSA